MEPSLNLNRVYGPSDDVVARNIAGELIIVPLASGIGDVEEELFGLNKTGHAIWERMDGTRRLCDIVEALASEFEATESEIQADVLGLVDELHKRGLVTEVTSV